MAYNGHVKIAGPDQRNLSSILRDCATQKSVLIFWNPVTSLWNFQDAAGVKFAGATSNPLDPLAELTAVRAALDVNGVDIP